MLNELDERQKELVTTEDKRLVLSRKWLKKKLIEKYKGTLYFTSEEERGDVLCFRDQTNTIL